MTKFGKCKLCLSDKALSLSHLLPAAFYKLMRDEGSPSPHPIVVNKRYAVQSSHQVRDHLLCKQCEQLLSKNGEQYVVATAFDGVKFPLPFALKNLKPAVTGPKIQAVSGVGTPSVDIDKLAYFAASVFWRASVHEWHAKGGTTISLQLGSKYEEEFRAFMMGRSAFPSNAAIWVVVSADAKPFPGFYFPCGGRRTGYYRYRFAVPGIEFFLFVGNRIPENVRKMCSASSPKKFIYLTDQVDGNTITQLAKLASTSKQATGIASVIRGVLSE